MQLIDRNSIYKETKNRLYKEKKKDKTTPKSKKPMTNIINSRNDQIYKLATENRPLQSETL